jgi:hypothetical protein
MDTEQFLQGVELLAGVDRDGARRAAQAALAERVGRPPPNSPRATGIADAHAVALRT